MIDIENKVFDTVYNAVIGTYPTAHIAGDYVDVPASFPCVTVIEADNYTYKGSLTGENVEHNASLMYEINVYAIGEDRKATAKSVMNIVDNAMIGMRFTREICTQTPNADTNVYRLTARYSAVVSEAIVSGTDTTYQMYRK